MEETKAVAMHRKWHGKVDVNVRCTVDTEEDLAVAYTPGVAEACLAIRDDISESYNLTRRWNQVAVITDGTAILGLGNIGPEAGMPVMEGKAALFKKFGDLDAIPLCVKTTDTEEIIKLVKYLEGNFAGINLEDISAPRCFEIEQRLKKELDIPVFHDDQWGTAIVTGGALINALKLVGKKIEDVSVVISGAGAAGTAIAKYLMGMGVKELVSVNRGAILDHDTDYGNESRNELARITNPKNKKGSLADALCGADVFVGVSVRGIVSEDMVKSMAKDPIIFACANPVPEITYEEAKHAGARVVGTGSSKTPNQVNNALVFPGLFRGAIDAHATDITMEMMYATSRAIAEAVSSEELSEEYILPKVVNPEVHKIIAKRVKEAWENRK